MTNRLTFLSLAVFLVMTLITDTKGYFQYKPSVDIGYDYSNNVNDTEAVPVLKNTRVASVGGRNLNRWGHTDKSFQRLSSRTDVNTHSYSVSHEGSRYNKYREYNFDDLSHRQKNNEYDRVWGYDHGYDFVETENVDYLMIPGVDGLLVRSESRALTGQHNRHARLAKLSVSSVSAKRVQTVPEPGVLALLGAGLIATGLRKRSGNI